MTNTYTPLATLTLTGTDTEIVFSSIPATYRDLVLVVAGTSDANTGLYLRFNSDTGTNYTTVGMYGNGSSAISFSQSLSFTNTNFISNTQGVNTVQVMDYSATDKHKTILARASYAGNQAQAAAARWANTAAITSITLFMDGGRSFQTGSTFSLYGVIA